MLNNSFDRWYLRQGVCSEYHSDTLDLFMGKLGPPVILEDSGVPVWLGKREWGYAYYSLSLRPASVTLAQVYTTKIHALFNSPSYFEGTSLHTPLYERVSEQERLEGALSWTVWGRSAMAHIEGNVLHTYRVWGRKTVLPFYR